MFPATPLAGSVSVPLSPGPLREWSRQYSLEQEHSESLGHPRLPLTCLPSGTLTRLGSRGQAFVLCPHELVCPKQECQLLRILVENQGRVNFSWKIQNQQKGGLW